LPRKPKGKEIANVYSFSLPGEYKPLMRRFDTLCFRENKGRGDILLGLIDKYVTKHWPSNPQTLLTYEPPFNRKKPPTLEIRILAREIDGLLETLAPSKIKERRFKRDEDERAFKMRVVRDLSRKAVRLERLNEIVLEDRYKELLERCSAVLKENQAI